MQPHVVLFLLFVGLIGGADINLPCVGSNATDPLLARNDF